MRRPLVFTAVTGLLLSWGSWAVLALLRKGTPDAEPQVGAPYRPVPGLAIWPGNTVGFEVASHTDVPTPSFRVRNESDDDIAFKSIKTGCSCTVVRSFPNVLAPHQEAELQLSVNQIGAFDTRFSSSLEIATNKGSFRLYIQAPLPKPTRVMDRPLAILIGNGDTSSEVMVVFPTEELRRELCSTFEVQTNHCNPKKITSLGEAKSLDGRTCVVTIEWENACVNNGASVTLRVGQQVFLLPVVVKL